MRNRTGNLCTIAPSADFLAQKDGLVCCCSRIGRSTGNCSFRTTVDIVELFAEISRISNRGQHFVEIGLQIRASGKLCACCAVLQYRVQSRGSGSDRRHSGRRCNHRVECNAVVDHRRHSGRGRSYCRHSGIMRPKLPDFCSLMYNVYTSNFERGKHI
nr:MAG TPA: hypothetical protein [Caudoviricetes sp.]